MFRVISSSSRQVALLWNNSQLASWSSLALRIPSSSKRAVCTTTAAATSSLIGRTTTSSSLASQQQQQQSLRFFSNNDATTTESHSDFAPQRKQINDDDSIQAMIAQHVQDNKIMLYMKGSPNMPMCGFSATVVQILKQQGVDFASVNVLDYPAIREGIKQYSDWPTIPQLYVKGEFIGGCDIVVAMQQSGELEELLKED